VFVSSIIFALVVLLGIGIWVWCVHAQRMAVLRAEALLEKHLTPDELDHFNKTGMLRVPSQLTPGRVYAVPTSGFISVLENNNMVMRLCIHPRAILAGREAVLAHKMYIEAAEEEYVRRAVIVWRSASTAEQALG